MSNRNIGLLRAARQEFADQILPKLKSSDRYTGAMLKRALDVLIIETVTDIRPESCLKPCGIDNANDLASALRARRSFDETTLAFCLRSFVKSKLQTNNPEYLENSERDEKGSLQ